MMLDTEIILPFAEIEKKLFQSKRKKNSLNLIFISCMYG